MFLLPNSPNLSIQFELKQSCGHQRKAFFKIYLFQKSIKSYLSIESLTLLIITIDKTWSNLSNHDLIFFFFQRRRVGRVQESNLMGSLIALAWQVYMCSGVRLVFDFCMFLGRACLWLVCITIIFVVE